MENKGSGGVPQANVTSGHRVLIRLKHSRATDAVIETSLPDSLEDFDDALARGDLEELRAKLDRLARAPG